MITTPKDREVESYFYSFWSRKNIDNAMLTYTIKKMDRHYGNLRAFSEVCMLILLWVKLFHRSIHIIRFFSAQNCLWLVLYLVGHGGGQIKCWPYRIRYCRSFWRTMGVQTCMYVQCHGVIVIPMPYAVIGGVPRAFCVSNFILN